MATRKKFISILAICAASVAVISSGIVAAEASQTFENDYRNSLWDGSGDSFSAEAALTPFEVCLGKLAGGETTLQHCVPQLDVAGAETAVSSS